MKILCTILLPLLLLTPASAETITIARRGSQPTRQGPAEQFTGTVRIEPLFQATDATRAAAGLVTFDAGAHSAWHAHSLG